MLVALYPLSSPNHNIADVLTNLSSVALYPLSSPNHNNTLMTGLMLYVALYPLSSPNHNLVRVFTLNFLLRYILFHHQTTTNKVALMTSRQLRYILFHHQTTTRTLQYIFTHCCVISSFITKPQPQRARSAGWTCCVISSFITKPQLSEYIVTIFAVALYPLSSPNHNHVAVMAFRGLLRYILFHHQTTTCFWPSWSCP